MKRYFLGVDIGTSQSKGVICDDAGELIASHAIDHVTSEVKPGHYEHDADKVWYGELCSHVKALLEKSGLNSDQISAVGCSAIGPCLLPVDAENKPLRNGILYGIDSRGEAERQKLNEEYGEDFIINHTGNVLTTQATGPKILWLADNEPEIYEQADCYMTASSYMVCKLTGERVIDHYTAAAGYTPLYDIDNKCWSELFCKRILGNATLPKLMWSSDIAGTVTEKAAAETGLMAGTPVIVGSADAASEAVSSGVVQPGKVMLMFGSTIFIIAVLDKQVKSDTLWAAPYLFEDSYAVAAGMSAAGSITGWFKNQFCSDLVEKSKESGINVYDLMMEETRSVPKGSDGLLVLPYFNGERTPINDPNATAAIFGLTFKHTRAHIYRAVFEGVGYGIKHIDECCGGFGDDVEIYCVGGGSKSGEWMQIISDILNRDVTVNRVSLGASYGNAFLAGLGVGAFKNSSDINNWVEAKKRYSPCAERSIYDKQYELYKQLYLNTKDIMHSL